MALPLTTPTVPDRYVGYWQLEAHGPRGERVELGHRIWIDVVVEEKEEGWELVRATREEGGQGEREEGARTMGGEEGEEKGEDDGDEEEKIEDDGEVESLLETAAAATLASSFPSPLASSLPGSQDWSKWTPQLELLAAMGFETRLDECVVLMEKIWKEEGEEGGVGGAAPASFSSGGAPPCSPSSDPSLIEGGERRSERAKAWGEEEKLQAVVEALLGRDSGEGRGR